MSFKKELIIVVICSFLIAFLVFYIDYNNKKIDSINESNIRLYEQIQGLRTQIYEDSLQIVEHTQQRTLLENQYENEKTRYRPTETIIIEKYKPLVILSDSQAIRLLANNLSTSFQTD